MTTNKPCPQCRSNGHDKTGDHLFLMEDNITWYCDRCKYKETEGGAVNIHKKLSLEDIAALPLRTAARGIKAITAEHFGVRMAVSEENGEPETFYYPRKKNGVVTGYSARRLPKTFTSIGDCRGDVELAGVGPRGGKYLIITGGDEDAMAAWQMQMAHNRHITYSVYSLVHGENSLKDISVNIEFIKSFQHVLVCTDMDEVGRKAAQNISAFIGSSARIMSFSEKDANDMLLAGKQKEFIAAFWAAEAHVPDGFLKVSDVIEEAKKMPEHGRPWPWKSLNKLTFGRRDGEGIYVGAGVKIGKDAWSDEMIHWITQHEKLPVAVFKFEEDPALTVKKLAGKVMNKQFHRPDGSFTQEELDKGVDVVEASGVLLFDSYMKEGKDDLWERLKPAIRHAVQIEGCKDIFINPITQLTDGMNGSDTDAYLRNFSNELAAMAKDLGFFYYCFCHLLKPDSGKPHEEGGHVHSNQFRGSRAMMEKTHFMLGIERNKLADTEEEKNKSSFVLLDNRVFGYTGRFPVYYDDSTGSYREPVTAFE